MRSGRKSIKLASIKSAFTVLAGLNYEHARGLFTSYWGLSPLNMPRVTKLSLPMVSDRGDRRDRKIKYPSRWDRFSKVYRRQHPFCAFCMERGFFNLGSPDRPNVVDHKYPVTDGGEMFPGPGGVHTLCASCHSGTKASLEIHARRTGQMDRIVIWCDDPTTRPRTL
jgi:hypothetical protein